MPPRYRVFFPFPWRASIARGSTTTTTANRPRCLRRHLYCPQQSANCLLFLLLAVWEPVGFRLLQWCNENECLQFALAPAWAAALWCTDRTRQTQDECVQVLLGRGLLQQAIGPTGSKTVFFAIPAFAADHAVSLTMAVKPRPRSPDS